MKSDHVPSTEEQAFLAHIIDDPADELRRLVFADWLDEHGQGQRAAYIRARCALDGKRPEFGSYADAVEQLTACRYQRPEVELPSVFSSLHRQGLRKDWWDDSDDTMEGGMVSLATVALRVVEDAVSTDLLAHGLQTLVETTTIRGLRIREWSLHHAEALFASPASSAITRLGLELSHDGDSACPAVAALATSPMAKTLTRLDLGHGVPNQATADALAAAPFDALRWFEAQHRCDSPEVYRRLMAAPWFGRLERLVTPVPPGTVGRVALPNLHTLGLHYPTGELVEALGRSAELPALRRLIFNGGDIRGAQATPLAALRCPELVELWLRAGTRPADLKILLAAPWARWLEVLTVHTFNSITPFNKPIDKSPCGKTLRIRRVGRFT